MSKPDPTAALAAACDALGEIMLSLQARALLARGIRNAVLRASAEERAKPDEQLAELAARALHAAAMVRPQSAELAAARAALQTIMVELQRRVVIGSVWHDGIRTRIEAEARTDAQLAELAANAFEAAATTLAALKHPGATAFSCNPTEDR